ncbi:MAG: thymidine phosphorylase [Janthinobacterium lividum]
MRVVDIIRKKRQGGEHTSEEIHFLIQNYVHSAVPDYQISAWLMAVLWRGLSETETFALTSAMIASGDTLDLSSLSGPCVDKHSTGGVGDKTTLAVVPILASAGVQVPKMSGRGLGHTGGTLDKLESLGGTRTEMETDAILAQVQSVGACICAQTRRLVPADRLLYALRDATDTVESLPLIAASIMSKKIAGGCPFIVLDVKVGGGAFMKTLTDARALAELMIKIGAAHGRKTVAVLSDMDVPLGYNVGNRVEVSEVVSLLQNNEWTEPRLKTVVCTLAGVGFVLAGRTLTLAEGIALAEAQIISGAAFQKLFEIVKAQGGDPDYLTHFLKPPVARIKRDVRAETSGFVRHVNAEAIGLAAMQLGAGRASKEDRIDPTAGVVLRETVGCRVTEGNVIATLFTGSEIAAREAATLVWSAFEIGSEPDPSRNVIYEIIGLDS